ncbi:MAG TPA: DUF2079 domain-containing protein [Polyangia bacterium]|nr:DUF2079 domain-containing protein [Polyangia bacterium]
MTEQPPSDLVGSEPRPGQAARALAGLIIAGASLALAIGQLPLRDLTGFATGNRSTPGYRNLLLALLGGGVVLVVAAAVTFWRRAAATSTLAERTARLHRAACLAAPLTLAAAVPGLFALGTSSDTATFALVLGAFVLAIEPLWRLHFGAYRTAHTPPAGPGPAGRTARRWFWTAVALAAAYAAYAIFFTLRNHARFDTYNWDLGQLDNEFWNALHGHPFRCTPLIREGNWSELRNHAEFSIYPLLPIYALHPAASTLLVLQSLLLGSGAIPLYRFAARRLPPQLALLVTAAYAFYPPMHGPQFFDFHFQPVASAFLLWAIDAFDTRRMRLFVVLWLIALGCREDVAIGTATIGLALVLGGYRTREGAVIAGVSAAYFVAMRFFIMPAVGAWGFSDIYRDLIAPGSNGFVGVVKTLATNPVYTFHTLLTPEKLRYALQIAAPLAFLPLRRPWLAVSMVPGAILTLLTTGYGPTLDIGYQYGCDFVPYVFPAVALALATLGAAPEGRARRRAGAATLALATFFATASWGAFPPRHSYHSAYWPISFDRPTPQERRRLAALEAAMRLVPPKAILAASDRELPHVSNRLDCWNLATGFEGADYVIYTKIDPIAPDRENVAGARAAGWVTVYDSPEIGLLRRPGAPTMPAPR